MLGQQCEIRAAATDRLQQIHQSPEHDLRRRAGHALGGGDGDQLRYQRVDTLARERGEFRIAPARTEASEIADHALGLGVADPGEPLGRGLGGDVAAPYGGELGEVGRVAAATLAGRDDPRRRRVGVTEHRGELCGHSVTMDGEGGIERRRAREAAGGSQRRALAEIGWQRLRLPVIAILQSVLDVAQENVGVAQRRDGGRGQ
jgi:hypothetical protein